MSRLLGILAIATVALPASACTVVRVEGPARVSSTHFGVLRIEPAPGAGMVAYRSSGVGLVAGPDGLTLGYSKADVALAYDPHRCQTIVFKWPSSAEKVRLLLKEVNETADICMTGGNKDEPSSR